MDHLPKPLHPVFAYPTIPYFCFEEYDCQDFRDYPESAGWTYDEVLNYKTWLALGKKGRRSFAEAKSFLQTWLFFGSLRAFFGDLVNFDDFIDKHPFKPPSIHTRNLMHTAENFIRQTEHQPLDRNALGGLVHDVGIAHNVYATILEACTLEPNFVLSIGLLLDFLDNLHTNLCQNHPDALDLCTEYRSDSPMVWPNTASAALLDETGRVEFLDAELSASGWCPLVVDKLRNRGLAFRLYALYLGPPDDQRSHSSCTLEQCLAYQIDKRRYIHRHAEQQCDCNHVEIDLKEMCSILQSGHIPLIRTEDPTEKGQPALLNTSDPDIKYVAISHVWSDGLGNPWKNSIASCQMRKICKTVQSLPSSSSLPAFWLDTLCCPIKPRDMKTLAIRKMRETYQHADVVLVLDAELEKLSLKETPLPEIAVRIFTSGWASRLWTWQEGALANKLYILLSDGVFNFEDLFSFIDEHDSNANPINYSGTLDGMVDTYYLVRAEKNVRKASAKSAFDIADVTNGIARRTTSVADDEPICIGAMMNLDLQPILDAKPEDRMYEFWKQCPRIPIKILFSKAPRLTKPGFRWAPPTLLGNIDHYYIKGARGGVATSRGLRIRCRGFLLLGVVDRPINLSFWLRDASGCWPLHVSSPDMESSGVLQAPIPDDTGTTYTHAALLVEENLTVDSPQSSTYCALVYVYADADGVLYARRTVRMFIELIDHPLATVRVLGEQDAIINHERKGVDESSHSITIDGVYHALECRTLGADQEWCID